MHVSLARRLPFRVVQRLAHTVEMRIDRHRIAVPTWGAAALAWIYRPVTPTRALLASLLAARQGTFVDVGANVGQTLADFLATGASHRYVGFEPNPYCIAYLSELIRASGLRDVEVVPSGIWNRTALQPLYFGAESADDQTASLRADLRPRLPRVRQWITSTTMDEAAAQLGLGAIAGVKIDVEGGELEVLQGMSATLATHAPPVLCEVLLADPNADLKEYEHRTRELQQFLRARDYRIFQCRMQRGRLTGLAPIDAFPIARWRPDSGDNCDYLFLPSSFALDSLLAPARQ